MQESTKPYRPKGFRFLRNLHPQPISQTPTREWILEEMPALTPSFFFAGKNSNATQDINQVHQAQVQYFVAYLELLRWRQSRDKVPKEKTSREIVESINKLASLHGIYEVMIIKRLGGLWLNSKDSVESPDLYLRGSQIYRLHRHLLNRAKRAYLREGTGKEAYSPNQLVHRLELSNCVGLAIQGDKDFSNDLLAEQTLTVVRDVSKGLIGYARLEGLVLESLGIMAQNREIQYLGERSKKGDFMPVREYWVARSRPV